MSKIIEFFKSVFKRFTLKNIVEGLTVVENVTVAIAPLIPGLPLSTVSKVVSIGIKCAEFSENAYIQMHRLQTTPPDNRKTECLNMLTAALNGSGITITDPKILSVMVDLIVRYLPPTKDAIKFAPKVTINSVDN
jgi:hypothetical protein